MGDDLEVDEMLEAAFINEDGNESSTDCSKENGHPPNKESCDCDGVTESKDYYKSSKRDRSNERLHDKHRNNRDKRDQVKDKKRWSRSRSLDRCHKIHSHDRHKRSRTRSRDGRKHSPSRSHDRRARRKSRSSSGGHRKRSRSVSRDRGKRHTKSKSKDRKHSKSKSRTPKRELTTEERDARTVFCLQLSSRIRSKDLEDFFSVVGRISDVRIITDAKTRRSKGIAYVEFVDVESVPLALGLSGQRILNVPIIVQPTLAEKNRLANAGVIDVKGVLGPMRLYVGSLHFNITEDMLRSIFEPFGKIDHIQLIMDTETGRSKGYGFITFHDADDAKKALEQLNGFELAGRPMKVNHVTERSDMQQGTSLLDSDEMERSGIELGATGRLQLMAKLAEGTGLELPVAATNVLNMPVQVQHQPAPTIATQCFLLSNMFDPLSETNPNWAQEIRDDVVDECNKHGGVLHVYVDRQSAQGNVYVKCPTIATAVAAVNILHGRFFAGKMITAAYVPVMSYHTLFPDALNATKLMMMDAIR